MLKKERKKMTKEEHLNRHRQLHVSLDELFADSITHARLRTKNTIYDLISWSYKQTQKLDHEEKGGESNG